MDQENNYNTRLLKWYFTSNKLVEIIKITNDNSIRQIIRYRNQFRDIIFFSSQNDKFNENESKLYWINKSDIDKINNNNIENNKETEDCQIYLNYITFCYNNTKINGSIWDFFIDSNTLYLSIPLITLDENRLSGFTTSARLFYFNILDIFTFFGLIPKNNIDVLCLIGNTKYPAGFDINSISTVQVITNPKTNKVYIYTLSDFLYQILSIINSNAFNKISNLIKLNTNYTLLDIILAIRNIFLNFDIEGTRIFEFSKDDLYKINEITINTVVGDPPYNTLNKSTTSNGYNSYTNGYTWCATSEKNNFYFGTLDIRSTIYSSLVLIIVQFLNNPPGLYEFLISLPEDLIIIITELFNPNFCIGNLEDLEDKKLYFDIINIKNDNISKITSSGFNLLNSINKFSDDGVRNLNIIKSCKNKYLLIGTTCYQPTNKSKNYLYNISDE